MIEVEINNNSEKTNKKIKFIKLDNRNFEEIFLDISEINSEEELIEKINDLKLDKNKFYKIILIGIKKIEINKNKTLGVMSTNQILKIDDKTQINYNIDKLSYQKNLKGIFVKKILDKLKDEKTDEKEIKRALEIGLKSFE